ncbi:MAG: hypothetical protein ABSG91_19280 [Syntrophobacteraceae bacterium]|jgi:hypothetical protein
MAQDQAPAPQPMVQETEWPGVSVALISAKSASGNMLVIKFSYSNSGAKKVDIPLLANMHADESLADQVYYVDAKNKKKYMAVKDSDGKTLGTVMRRDNFSIEPAGSRNCWVQFPAPPADATKISVYLPGAPPFEDVSIQ